MSWRLRSRLQRGLMLTVDMFEVLQEAIPDGMPALRIQVGAAQATEMLATLFTGDFPSQRLRGVTPGRHQICGRQTTAQVGTRSVRKALDRESSGPVHEHRKEHAVRSLPVGSVAAAVPPQAPPPPAAADVEPLPVNASVSRYRRWAETWGRQKVVVKIAATLVAIVLAATLIDAPFAILALFPDYFLPLVSAFVGIFIVCEVAYRALRSRKRLSVVGNLSPAGPGGVIR